MRMTHASASGRKYSNTFLSTLASSSPAAAAAAAFANASAREAGHGSDWDWDWNWLLLLLTLCRNAHTLATVAALRACSCRLCCHFTDSSSAFRLFAASSP